MPFAWHTATILATALPFIAQHAPIATRLKVEVDNDAVETVQATAVHCQSTPTEPSTSADAGLAWLLTCCSIAVAAYQQLRRRSVRSQPNAAADVPRANSPAEVKQDEELRHLLVECLDSRIVERTLATLDAEDVFDLDGLCILVQMRRFREVFTAVSAERIERQLAARGLPKPMQSAPAALMMTPSASALSLPGAAGVEHAGAQAEVEGVILEKSFLPVHDQSCTSFTRMPCDPDELLPDGDHDVEATLARSAARHLSIRRIAHGWVGWLTFWLEATRARRNVQRAQLARTCKCRHALAVWRRMTITRTAAACWRDSASALPARRDAVRTPSPTCSPPLDSASTLATPTTPTMPGPSSTARPLVTPPPTELTPSALACVAFAGNEVRSANGHPSLNPPHPKQSDTLAIPSSSVPELEQVQQRRRLYTLAVGAPSQATTHEPSGHPATTRPKRTQPRDFESRPVRRRVPLLISGWGSPEYGAWRMARATDTEL